MASKNCLRLTSPNRAGESLRFGEIVKENFYLKQKCGQLGDELERARRKLEKYEENEDQEEGSSGSESEQKEEDEEVEDSSKQEAEKEDDKDKKKKQEGDETPTDDGVPTLIPADGPLPTVNTQLMEQRRKELGRHEEVSAQEEKQKISRTARKMFNQVRLLHLCLRLFDVIHKKEKNKNQKEEIPKAKDRKVENRPAIRSRVFLSYSKRTPTKTSFFLLTLELFGVTSRTATRLARTTRKVVSTTPMAPTKGKGAWIDQTERFRRQGRWLG